MNSVKNGSMDKNRKMILYSGHDLNIVAVLSALGVFDPHLPKFSSAVILELISINSINFFIKVSFIILNLIFVIDFAPMIYLYFFTT